MLTEFRLENQMVAAIINKNNPSYLQYKLNGSFNAPLNHRGHSGPVNKVFVGISFLFSCILIGGLISESFSLRLFSHTKWKIYFLLYVEKWKIVIWHIFWGNEQRKRLSEIMPPLSWLSVGWLVFLVHTTVRNVAMGTRG